MGEERDYEEEQRATAPDEQEAVKMRVRGRSRRHFDLEKVDHSDRQHAGDKIGHGATGDHHRFSQAQVPVIVR